PLWRIDSKTLQKIQAILELEAIEGFRRLYEDALTDCMRHHADRSFGPVFDVLAGVDHGPRPGLPDRERLHALRFAGPALHTLNTFITSSPKWLITFTAILPVEGRANGRDSAR